MADISSANGFAIGIQTALGTINATIRDLTGALTVADGIVLGDRESGDGESGILFPTIGRNERAVADVAGSFTRQPGSFQRANLDSFAITIQLKGNGAASTPSAGEAKPDPGIDALLQIAGLAGANGTSPEFVYKPIVGPAIYATVKFWTGAGAVSQPIVMEDVICESTVFTFPPGETPLITFNMGGIHIPAAGVPGDVETFPTFDYGTQATLSAPANVSAAYDFGGSTNPLEHGWSEAELEIEQSVQTIPDANQALGLRISPSGRSFNWSQTLYGTDELPTVEYDNVVSQALPANSDGTFTLGDVAAPTDPLNAMVFAMNNQQWTSWKANKEGNFKVNEGQAYLTAATAGEEFSLTFA